MRSSSSGTVRADSLRHGDPVAVARGLVEERVTS
jgi:hypothetical protein